jgi:hypothetical protein
VAVNNLKRVSGIEWVRSIPGEQCTANRKRDLNGNARKRECGEIRSICKEFAIKGEKSIAGLRWEKNALAVAINKSFVETVAKSIIGNSERRRIRKPQSSPVQASAERRMRA